MWKIQCRKKWYYQFKKPFTLVAVVIRLIIFEAGHFPRNVLKLWPEFPENLPPNIVDYKWLILFREGRNLLNLVDCIWTSYHSCGCRFGGFEEVHSWAVHKMSGYNFLSWHFYGFASNTRYAVGMPTKPCISPAARRPSRNLFTSIKSGSIKLTLSDQI